MYNNQLNSGLNLTPGLPPDVLIETIFGAAKARQGQRLWQAGLLAEYDAINDEYYAEVEDNASVFEVFLWQEDASYLETDCDCGVRLCSHAAALLYAILNEDIIEEDIEEEATPEPIQGASQPAAGSIIPAPSEWQANLRRHLAEQTVAQLREIARRRGWPLKGTLKDDIVEQMANYMIENNGQPGWLDGLSEDERDLLAALHTLYGWPQSIMRETPHLAWQRLVANNKSLPGKGRYEKAFQGLQSYGLFYPCRAHRGDHFHPFMPLSPATLPVYSLPGTLKAMARRQAGEVESTSPPIVQLALQIGQYAAGGGAFTITPRDWQPHSRAATTAWLGDWPHRAEEVEVLMRQPYLLYGPTPSRVTVPFRQRLLQPESVAPLLDSFTDHYQLEWLAFLLNSAGLLGSKDKTEIGLQEANWNEFVAVDPGDQWSFLFRVWSEYHADLYPPRRLLQRNPNWSVWRTVHPEFTFEHFLSDHLGAQQLMVRLLRSLVERDGAGSWYRVDDFLTQMQQLRPDGYHSYSFENAWGFQRQQQILLPDDTKQWRATFGRMFELMLAGPLHWLGLVNVEQVNDIPVRFQITSIGNWLLNPHRARAPAALYAMESEAGSANWLDEATIEVRPGHEVARLLSLMSQLGERTDKPFTYQLSGPGLEQAFARGERPETLAEQFAEAGAPLPEATRRYLQDLHDRYGQVHLYEKLTVVEFADDLALTELRAASSLFQKALVHEFSPRLAVIDGHYVDSLMDDLIKKGYTPSLTTGAGVKEKHEGQGAA